jgi:hypothetical protein
MKSNFCAVCEINNFIYRFYYFIVIIGILSSPPVGYCGSQAIEYFPVFANKIGSDQFSLGLERRHKVKECALFSIESANAMMPSSNFKFPTLHESSELSSSSYCGFSALALLGNIIGKESDGGTASGGYESAKDGGEDFFMDVIQLISVLIGFLIGLFLILLFIDPIHQRAFKAIGDSSESLFCRRDR